MKKHWEIRSVWPWGSGIHSGGGWAMLHSTVSTHIPWDKQEQQKTWPLSPPPPSVNRSQQRQFSWSLWSQSLLILTAPSCPFLQDLNLHFIWASLKVIKKALNTSLLASGLPATLCWKFADSMGTPAGNVHACLQADEIAARNPGAGAAGRLVFLSCHCSSQCWLWLIDHKSSKLLCIFNYAASLSETVINQHLKLVESLAFWYRWDWETSGTVNVRGEIASYPPVLLVSLNCMVIQKQLKICNKYECTSYFKTQEWERRIVMVGVPGLINWYLWQLVWN